jgi:hypothetical protein
MLGGVPPLEKPTMERSRLRVNRTEAVPGSDRSPVRATTEISQAFRIVRYRYLRRPVVHEPTIGPGAMLESMLTPRNRPSSQGGRTIRGETVTGGRTVRLSRLPKQPSSHDEMSNARNCIAARICWRPSSARPGTIACRLLRRPRPTSISKPRVDRKDRGIKAPCGFGEYPGRSPLSVIR